jgi:hypothetical protein
MAETNKQKTARIISEHPRACYRTLVSMIPNDSESEKLLAAARPLCGYDCDGDEDGVGCPVSGRCER